VRVVGTDGTSPDPAGTFTLTVRDCGNNPQPNVQVIVDFGFCSDVEICDVAPPGQIVDCPTKTIRGFTNGAGQITFTIVGAGRNTGAGPGPGVGCANILLNSVSITHPTVVVFDQNGLVLTPGVEVTDLAAWLKDFGTGFYFGRSDYDMLGAVDVADLSAWLKIFGAARSFSGCTSYCP